MFCTEKVFCVVFFFLSKEKKISIKIFHSFLTSEVYAVSLVIKAQGWILRHMHLIPSSTTNPHDDLEQAT